MTTELWKKQVPVLSKDHRVITMDCRGHGNSSKTLNSHTIPRYAKDVRALIEHLKLDDAVLIGWSLAGPVVLSYWEQFGGDKIKALGMVDTGPSASPVPPSESKPSGDFNFDVMNKTVISLEGDRRKIASGLVKSCFKDGKASKEDIDWIVSEHLKTPTAIAGAIYSDYALRDYTGVLEKITVPVIVFSGTSPISEAGFKLGRWMCSRIPKATFAPFKNGGHLLFYEQPEKFNAALVDFIKGLE
jgi:pimeloyl-ACP methyl ester carboxylesterase